MAEYVELNLVIEALAKIASQTPFGKSKTVAKCIDAVELLPSSPHIPRFQRGRWIPEENSDVYFSCSYCGCEICTSWDYDDLEWNFCPERGCAMDGGADNG